LTHRAHGLIESRAQNPQFHPIGAHISHHFDTLFSLCPHSRCKRLWRNHLQQFYILYSPFYTRNNPHFSPKHALFTARKTTPSNPLFSRTFPAESAPPRLHHSHFWANNSDCMNLCPLIFGPETAIFKTFANLLTHSPAVRNMPMVGWKKNHCRCQIRQL
jgi:hypothetical protein